MRPHEAARLRHRLQVCAFLGLDRSSLPDAATEADEVYVNAGEKGEPHVDPDDPPRHRANKRRGHGTFANDRPPIAGVVGRETGEIRLEVIGNSDGDTLEGTVGDATAGDAMVYMDEWAAYNRLVDMGRGHATVCHSDHEGARDDDGDGIREVHDNTLEGIWTGLRDFLRPFRGVSKWKMRGYVAIFQWGYNLKRVTGEFLRCLLARTPRTILAS